MNSKQLKILILEDNEADAELIRRLLVKHNALNTFRVMMTKDELLISLNEFKPHVVLSDNAMPQFSASEALSIVRSNSPHIPFILVTGTVSEEFAVHILNEGADDYLLKDRLTRLPDAIETAIKKKDAQKERLEAIEKLRKSEERYRSMMSRVTDGFVAIDKSGYYTYVNQKAADILSKQPGDMVGKNIWELFPQAVGMPFYHTFYEAINGQRYVTITNYFDTVGRWIENHFYPASDGVSIFFRDVTEQRLHSEAIRQSEEKYRLLIERMSDCFIELDKDFCYTYVNKRYAELARMNPEELIGRNIWEVFPIAVGTAGYHMYYQVVKEQRYMWHTIYSPGVALWHEDHVYPNGNGGIFAFIRDITENKVANDRLVQRERYFRALVENNDGIISLLDCSLNTIYRSESVARITGWSLEEFELFGARSFIHPQDLDYMQAQVAAALEQPATAINICFRGMHKHGRQIWLEGVLTNMLHDEAVGGIITNLRDITERRKAEDRLQEQQAQLQTISDNLPGVTLFQLEGTPENITSINYISNGITSITGCSPQEVKDDPSIFYNRILPDDMPLLMAAHERAALSMQVYNIEVRCINYLGELRWLNIVSTPRNINPRRLVWDGFHIDITGRKEANEKLRMANERFELLASTTNDVIWDCDLATGKLWWNNSYHKLFGFEVDPPPHIDAWRTYIHADDRDRIAESVRRQ